MKRPRLLAFAFVATIVCVAVGSVYAISFGGPGGDWPKTWPKELEGLRKQAWTWTHGDSGDMSYDIPFATREEFEAAWPHLLKLKSKGSPIVLVSGPHVRAGSGKSAGIRISEPFGAKKPPADLASIPNYEIMLTVDGKIIDLNRFRLPADTTFDDQRYKDTEEKKPARSGAAAPKPEGLPSASAR